MTYSDLPCIFPVQLHYKVVGYEASKKNNLFKMTFLANGICPCKNIYFRKDVRNAAASFPTMVKNDLMWRWRGIVGVLPANINVESGDALRY